MKKLIFFAILCVALAFFLYGRHKLAQIEKTVERAKAENHQHSDYQRKKEYDRKYNDIFGWLK